MGRKFHMVIFVGLSSTNVPIGKEKNVVHCYKEIPSEPPRLAKIQSKESKATFTNTNNGLDTPPQLKLSKKKMHFARTIAYCQYKHYPSNILSLIQFF